MFSFLVNSVKWRGERFLVRGRGGADTEKEQRLERAFVYHAETNGWIGRLAGWLTDWLVVVEKRRNVKEDREEEGVEERDIKANRKSKRRYPVEEEDSWGEEVTNKQGVWLGEDRELCDYYVVAPHFMEHKLRTRVVGVR